MLLVNMMMNVVDAFTVWWTVDSLAEFMFSGEETATCVASTHLFTSRSASVVRNQLIARFSFSAPPKFAFTIDKTFHNLNFVKIYSN